MIEIYESMTIQLYIRYIRCARCKLAECEIQMQNANARTNCVSAKFYPMRCRGTKWPTTRVNRKEKTRIVFGRSYYNMGTDVTMHRRKVSEQIQRQQTISNFVRNVRV